MRLPRLMPRTIRGRVTAVAVMIVAVALGLAGYVTVRLQERVLTDRVEDTLSARGDDLTAGVRAGTLSTTLDSTGREGGLAQIVDPSGKVVAATPNASGAPPIVAIRPPPGREVMVRVDRLPIDDEAFLVLAQTVVGPAGPRTVLVAESLDAVASAREALIPIIAVGLPVILLLVGSVTALALRRALQPVERARREVEAIGSDRLDRRLTPLGTGDEIDRLTTTMNDLLDRLAAAYRREQQFVGDASHELRSPLASIRAQLEADLEDPARADPLRTEAGVLEEVSRLEGLVDALLALARTRRGRVSPPTLLDLDDIVLDELRRLRPGAVALGTAGVSAGQVRGDRGDLERAVRNLLDNAVRHARSRVDVTLAERGGRVVLTVANDGDPVPPGERERMLRPVRAHRRRSSALRRRRRRPGPRHRARDRGAARRDDRRQPRSPGRGPVRRDPPGRCRGGPGGSPCRGATWPAPSPSGGVEPDQGVSSSSGSRPWKPVSSFAVPPLDALLADAPAEEDVASTAAGGEVADARVEVAHHDAPALDLGEPPAEDQRGLGEALAVRTPAVAAGGRDEAGGQLAVGDHRPRALSSRMSFSSGPISAEASSSV